MSFSISHCVEPKPVNSTAPRNQCFPSFFNSFSDEPLSTYDVSHTSSSETSELDYDNIKNPKESFSFDSHSLPFPRSHAPDFLRAVLYDGITTEEEFQKQDDALSKIRRKWGRKQASGCALILSANILSRALISGQFTLKLWKVLEAQTLSEGLSLLTLQLKHMTSETFPSRLLDKEVGKEVPGKKVLSLNSDVINDLVSNNISQSPALQKQDQSNSGIAQENSLLSVSSPLSKRYSSLKSLSLSDDTKIFPPRNVYDINKDRKLNSSHTTPLSLSDRGIDPLLLPENDSMFINSHNPSNLLNSDYGRDRSYSGLKEISQTTTAGVSSESGEFGPSLVTSTLRGGIEELYEKNHIPSKNKNSLVLPTVLARLVVVDCFTDENFFSIAQALRQLDQQLSLGLCIVLLLTPKFTAGQGYVSTPSFQITFSDAYEAGYDLVLLKQFDHQVVEFFSNMFLSSSARWRTDLQNRATVGNYQRVRAVLSGQDDPIRLLEAISWTDMDEPFAIPLPNSKGRKVSGGGSISLGNPQDLADLDTFQILRRYKSFQEAYLPEESHRPLGRANSSPAAQYRLEMDLLGNALGTAVRQARRQVVLRRPDGSLRPELLDEMEEASLNEIQRLNEETISLKNTLAESQAELEVLKKACQPSHLSTQMHVSQSLSHGSAEEVSTNSNKRFLKSNHSFSETDNFFSPSSHTNRFRRDQLEAITQQVKQKSGRSEGHESDTLKKKHLNLNLKSLDAVSDQLENHSDGGLSSINSSSKNKLIMDLRTKLLEAHQQLQHLTTLNTQLKQENMLISAKNERNYSSFSPNTQTTSQPEVEQVSVSKELVSPYDKDELTTHVSFTESKGKNARGSFPQFSELQMRKKKSSSSLDRKNSVLTKQGPSSPLSDKKITKNVHSPQKKYSKNKKSRKLSKSIPNAVSDYFSSDFTLLNVDPRDDAKDQYTVPSSSFTLTDIAINNTENRLHTPTGSHLFGGTIKELDNNYRELFPLYLYSILDKSEAAIQFLTSMEQHAMELRDFLKISDSFSLVEDPSLPPGSDNQYESENNFTFKEAADEITPNIKGESMKGFLLSSGVLPSSIVTNQVSNPDIRFGSYPPLQSWEDTIAAFKSTLYVSGEGVKSIIPLDLIDELPTLLRNSLRGVIQEKVDQLHQSLSALPIERKDINLSSLDILPENSNYSNQHFGKDDSSTTIPVLGSDMGQMVDVAHHTYSRSQDKSNEHVSGKHLQELQKAVTKATHVEGALPELLFASSKVGIPFSQEEVPNVHPMVTFLPPCSSILNGEEVSYYNTDTTSSYKKFPPNKSRTHRPTGSSANFICSSTTGANAMNDEEVTLWSQLIRSTDKDEILCHTDRFILKSLKSGSILGSDNSKVVDSDSKRECTELVSFISEYSTSELQQYHKKLINSILATENASFFFQKQVKSSNLLKFSGIKGSQRGISQRSFSTASTIQHQSIAEPSISESILDKGVTGKSILKLVQYVESLVLVEKELNQRKILLSSEEGTLYDLTEKEDILENLVSQIIQLNHDGNFTLLHPPELTTVSVNQTLQKLETNTSLDESSTKDGSKVECNVPSIVGVDDNSDLTMNGQNISKTGWNLVSSKGSTQFDDSRSFLLSPELNSARKHHEIPFPEANQNVSNSILRTTSLPLSTVGEVDMIERPVTMPSNRLEMTQPKNYLFFQEPAAVSSFFLPSHDNDSNLPNSLDKIPSSQTDHSQRVFLPLELLLQQQHKVIYELLKILRGWFPDISELFEEYFAEGGVFDDSLDSSFMEVVSSLSGDIVFLTEFVDILKNVNVKYNRGDMVIERFSIPNRGKIVNDNRINDSSNKLGIRQSLPNETSKGILNYLQKNEYMKLNKRPISYDGVRGGKNAGNYFPSNHLLFPNNDHALKTGTDTAEKDWIAVTCRSKEIIEKLSIQNDKFSPFYPIGIEHAEDENISCFQKRYGIGTTLSRNTGSFTSFVYGLPVHILKRILMNPDLNLTDTILFIPNANWHPDDNKSVISRRRMARENFHESEEILRVDGVTKLLNIFQPSKSKTGKNTLKTTDKSYFHNGRHRFDIFEKQSQIIHESLVAQLKNDQENQM